MTAITWSNLREALEEVDAWADAYPAETVLALWEAEAWKMLDYPSWEALCDSRGWTNRVALPRPERREIVSTLRQEGMSTRAIAAATGVSKDTVARDLAGVSPETPAPVRGTDGKTYQPTQPVKPAIVPEVVDTVPADDYLAALERYPELDVDGAEAGDVVEIAAAIDARPEHERQMRTDIGVKYLTAKAEGRLTPAEPDPLEAGDLVYRAAYEALKVIDRYCDDLPTAIQHADPATRDIWTRTISRLGEQTLNMLDALPKSTLRRIK